MNEHEKKHILVILGAGATAGSGFKLNGSNACPPCDKDFFKIAKNNGWLENDLASRK